MTVLYQNIVIVFLNSFLARASPVFLSVNLFNHFVAARAPLPLPKFHGRKLITANSSRNNQSTIAAPSTMIRQ